MALQDHFHPPLSESRHWHSFHSGWATNLASDLNQLLPDGWFAEPNVQFGIKIDVAAMKERERMAAPSHNPPSQEWYIPPLPVQIIPFEYAAETIEIAVYDSTAGPILAAAIELISPTNKERSESRQAFVSKCETYLRQCIGLITVDIVTNRKVNLHSDLMARFNESAHLSTELYTTSFHPVEIEGQTKLEIWEEPLMIGRPLVTMPLWLRGGLCLPVDLDATYQRTCLEQRIKLNGF